MTAERHNRPQHNLYAKQAGNAGDCTPSGHSRLPWRRLGRFFATTMLASFVLNEIWEMAQMSAYVEIAGHSWTSTLGLCTRATVGCGNHLGHLPGGRVGRWRSGMGLARPLEHLRYGGCNGARLCGAGGTCGADRRALVVLGAHARGVHAWRGPVAATPNDPAASAHVFVCAVVGRSQRNGRGSMMNQTGGWMGGSMGGWAGGGMWIWTVIGVLVVVLLVVVISKQSKK